MKKRFLYLAMGCLGFLCLGVSYAWGVFVVPLEKAFGYSRTATSLAFTVCCAMFSIGVLLVGQLAKKLKVGVLMKMAALFVGCGLLLSGFTRHIALLYLTYSLIAGIGIGMGYNILISVVPSWFPDMTGTATGILVMCYAFSSAFLSPVVAKLIGVLGVQMAFRVIGLICFTGLFLVSFFIRYPNMEEYRELPKQKLRVVEAHKEIETGKMLRMPLFYVYFALVVLIGGIGLAVINHTSPIMTEEMLATTALATTMVSINAIANGSARMVWGMIFDRIGMMATWVLICTFGLAAAIVVCIGILSGTVVIYIIGSVLAMLAFGGNASTIPLITRTLFGSEHFAENYGMMNFNALFSALFPSLIGTIQNISGGYRVPGMVILALGILTYAFYLIFLLLYRKEFGREEK